MLQIIMQADQNSANYNSLVPKKRHEKEEHIIKNRPTIISRGG